MPQNAVKKLEKLLQNSKKLSAEEKQKLLTELRNVEVSHPKLSQFIESIVTTLSNLGV